MVTCNKGDETNKIYINDDIEESETLNSGSYTVADIGDLFLGRNYTGRLDDVILFNSVLSNSEVKDLFKTVPFCP